jgi:iron complex outermembrane receptor protein
MNLKFKNRLAALNAVVYHCYDAQPPTRQFFVLTFFIAVFCLVFLISAFSPRALAQNAEQNAAQSAEQSARQLSAKNENDSTQRAKISRGREVIVTAQRKPERSLDVPLAVSVVPKSLFENTRGLGLDEALALVPGALAQSRSGNQDVRITIRGFGARGAGERSNAGTSRGLRFYIDGIPETEPDGRTAFDLIDLARTTSIEVVRSNASSLWGNAAGGIVIINTIPDHNEPFLSLQAQTGSFGFWKQHLRAGVVTDVGKIYVSANNASFDGYREHSQSALRQLYMGVVSDISPKTQVKTFLSFASNAFQIPGPLTEDQFEENPRQAQNDRAIYNPTYLERQERRFNRLGRIGMTLNHDFDEIGGVAHSFSAMAFLQNKYLQRSERNTFRDFHRYHFGGNALYRLKATISDDAKFTVLAGADAQYQDGSILFYNLVRGQRGQNLQTNKREGAQNLGAFAQAEMDFGANLSVVGALRYDNIAYYNENFFNPRTNEARDFERITPKFGVNYRITPLWTIYANLGGGVEVPAGNETDPPSVFGEDTVRSINALLKPIESTTYEIGMKQIVALDNDAFLQLFSYDIALYHIDITNDIIPYRGGRFYFTAGRSERRGMEIGAQADFAGGVTAWATATFSSNILTDYRIDSVFIDRRLEGREANFSGNAAPGIPEVFSTVRVRYQPDFAPFVFTELEWRAVGSYFVNDANTLQAPAFSILDAALGFRQNFLNERLRLRAFARLNNLTDERYVASVWINPDRAADGRSAYIEPGLPRNFVVSVGAEWRF